MTAKTKERLEKIAKWCQQDKALWDILTALRGPDSPSERPDMSPSEASNAYRARRLRKFKTGEVIRGVSGLHAGEARYRVDTHVSLPPSDRWDHYDKHVWKAASALGLEIRTDDGSPVPELED